MVVSSIYLYVIKTIICFFIYNFAIAITGESNIVCFIVRKNQFYIGSINRFTCSGINRNKTYFIVWQIVMNCHNIAHKEHGTLNGHIVVGRNLCQINTSFKRRYINGIACNHIVG